MKLFYVDFQVDYARIYDVNTSSDEHKLGVCEAGLDLIIGLRGTFTMRAIRITLEVTGMLRGRVWVRRLLLSGFFT